MYSKIQFSRASVPLLQIRFSKLLLILVVIVAEKVFYISFLRQHYRARGKVKCHNNQQKKKKRVLGQSI